MATTDKFKQYIVIIYKLERVRRYQEDTGKIGSGLTQFDFNLDRKNKI